LNDVNPAVVAGLISAMSIFDPDIAQHLIATATLAERVAVKMGLDKETVESCRIGALLHDVGMLAVDKSIVNHPGMLVNAEWDILAEHPVLGARLLLSTPTLEHIAPIVRLHHERIDGSGYPEARFGYEIPIEARIIAVVDAFHTMTTPLGYRNAFVSTTAIKEIVGNSGSQFDSDVVEAFTSIVGFRQRRLREA
jgi:putative nucleotidyltransferase with HDIG domain